MYNKLKKIALLLVLSTSLSMAYGQNPIIQTKFTADPAPMVYRDKVYLYTSHDENDAPPQMGEFLMRDWLCYTSIDMVNWTDHGTVASLRNFKWADKAITGWGGYDNGAWAPQTVERNGKFYMYCPVQGRGIGVLVANNPLGPFVDPIGKPLIGAKYDSIDPTVLIDDDGRAYLYWGNPNLWYAKLNNDMVSLSGEIIKDSSVAKIKDQPDPFHYQEGPWAFKRINNYYMAYASTCCPEGIGYAMSKSPTGPWQFKGYLMKPNKKSSGNHPGIIDYKGKSYLFGFNYQLNFRLTDKHHERRSVCIAELSYNTDGTITELPWWEDKAITQIGTLNPYTGIEAETINWALGVKTERDGMTKKIYVTNIDDNDYLKVRGVNFKKGAKIFEATYASGSKDKGEIEIRTDSLNGELLGVMPVTYTGGGLQWKNLSVKVKPISGVHDLYFLFKGKTAGICNLDKWRFK
jgi:arabinoxylan arabinofuranohydrolase